MWVTYNQNLLAGQLQGIEANLEQTRTKLRELQHGLRRWRENRVQGGRKPAVDGVRHQVERALSAQFMKKLIAYESCWAIEPNPTSRARFGT